MGIYNETLASWRYVAGGNRDPSIVTVFNQASHFHRKLPQRLIEGVYRLYGGNADLRNE